MRSLPSSFCWTKMGAESGQTLETIIKRKELERESGGGFFCWGIGNSLGDSLKTALRESGEDKLKIVFTRMKSAAKKIDSQPEDVSLWLDFVTSTGEICEVPKKSLVVSRAHTPQGITKKHHYALLCHSKTPLSGRPGDNLAVVASKARNYQTGKSIGFSQVTSIVTYETGPGMGTQSGSQEYRVVFSADIQSNSLLRLVNPVLITGRLKTLYNQVCESTSVTEWSNLIQELRDEARSQTHPARSQSLQGTLPGLGIQL